MATGMKLSVHTNMDEVFAALDRMAAVTEQVAIPRAIAKLTAQAKVAGVREAARLYELSPRRFEAYLDQYREANYQFAMTLRVKGVALAMWAFQPRQTARGVSVRIKGRRFVIPHSFIQRMPNGHVGVFARGSYGGKANKRKLVATGETFGAWVFGKMRLPINEFYTFSAAQAWRNPEVTQAMVDRLEQQANKVIAAELRYARRAA